MAKPAKSAPTRRSGRIQARIPIILSGTLPDGSSFTEDTYILTVSKFGAKVKTERPLNVGMEVKVQPKRGEGETRFRVVWTGREGTPRQGEVGIEYIQLTNLFGVNFPH